MLTSTYNSYYTYVLGQGNHRLVSNGNRFPMSFVVMSYMTTNQPVDLVTADGEVRNEDQISYTDL